MNINQNTTQHNVEVPTQPLAQHRPNQIYTQKITKETTTHKPAPVTINYTYNSTLKPNLI
jgi:hypothetical protein